MRALILQSLLLMIVCGCASPSSRVSAPEALLRSGECLLVQVTNRPVPEIRRIIGPAGNISLPWVGELRVAGLTLQQAGAAIVAAYHPTFPPLEVSVLRCP
jgi:protein involved in polysaccharide export with SLBB domain